MNEFERIYNKFVLFVLKEWKMKVEKFENDKYY